MHGPLKTRPVWFSVLHRLPYNLHCVGGDVKHCSLTQCFTAETDQWFSTGPRLRPCSHWYQYKCC